MKKLGGFIVAASLLLGCNTKSGDRQVAGQVVLREDGGLSLLVSNMQICAVEVAAADRHLAEARKLAAAEAEKARGKVADLTAQWKLSQEEVRDAQAALLAALREPRGSDLFAQPPKVTAATARAHNVADKAKAIREDLETREAVLQTYERFAKDGDFAFGTPWPEVFAKSTTDASGNFKISLPRDRPMVLVGCFDRHKGAQFQRSMWAVTVLQSEAGPVQLSSSNLLNK